MVNAPPEPVRVIVSTASAAAEFRVELIGADQQESAPGAKIQK